MKDYNYYKNSGLYNKEQLIEIKIGLDNNIDVELAARPEYSSNKIWWIICGLAWKIDYKYLKNENYSAEFLEKIVYKLSDAKPEERDDIFNLMLIEQ